MTPDAWVTADVAKHTGLAASSVRAYSSTGVMPPPDGRLGGKPWWHPETITKWRPAKTS